MGWFRKLLNSIKRVFRAKNPEVVVPKVSRLESSVKRIYDEMKTLRSLKDFYSNDKEANKEQIKEVDLKISVLRQEIFAKNREIRREKSKENLKVLKTR